MRMRRIFSRTVFRAAAVGVAAALLCSLAIHAPSARAASGDLVVSFEVDDVDPALVPLVLNTDWPNAVGSGTVAQEMVNTVNKNRNEYGDNSLTPELANGTTISTSVNPNAVSSTNITIDVPVGDVTGQSSYWVSGLVATVIASGIYLISYVLCLAGFAAPTGGIAIPVCGAIANGLSTLAWFLVGAKFAGRDVGSPTVLGVAFAGAVISAITGWIGVIAPLAAGPLRNFFIKIAGWARTALIAALTWVANFITVDIPAFAGWVANIITSVGSGIAGFFRQAAANAGQPPATAPVPLRPLAFGDSITWGYQSSDGSGYRCHLEKYLDDLGDSHNFVGSLTNGTCSESFSVGPWQPNNEGHPGWTISQLDHIMPCTIGGYMPNIVLLDIGTNDINNGGSGSVAASDIEGLISGIFVADPHATVLVSSLIYTPNSSVASQMATFNQQVSSWIDQQNAQHNTRVAFVDMAPVKLFDLADGLHPTDAGYEKMAFPWMQAIQTAVSKGWIGAPDPPKSCAWQPVWFPQGGIATGPGYKALPLPGNLTVGSGDQVIFTDINGDGRADLAVVHSNSSMDAWLNGGQTSTGNVTWLAQGTVATGVGAAGNQIRLADINGDGKADYLLVNADSSVQAWINGGPNPSGGYYWYPQGTVATGVFVPGAEVQFADINGDGKADYLVVSGQGQVNAWLNGGPNPSGGYYWLPAGTVATGVGAPASQIKFTDLNGDGKADYLNLNPDGSVQAWLNGGPNPNGGYYWYPQGTIATGVGVSSADVRFGDINGDHRADYLTIDPGNGLTVKEWLNGGPPSSGSWPWYPVGTITDGSYSYRIKFANVSPDVKADFVVVNEDSSLKFWLNGGGNSSSWNWTGPINLATGVGDPGTQIQLADINGDGLADYLDVDAATGAVKAWVNGGTTWYPQGTIATGVGAPGSQIRFADINGDGRADYLDVNPNSSVQAWLNGGPNPSGGYYWFPAGTVATGVGDPGSQIQFADLNGDGMADYIDVRPDGQEVQAWLNGGPNPSGGYYWYPQGPITTSFNSGEPGSWIQFADINGDGKADFLATDPTTGATQAWINGG